MASWRLRSALSAGVVVAMALCCSGGYVITTPREWVQGGLTKMCVDVDEAEAPAGAITVSAYKVITHYKKEDEIINIMDDITIPVPPGNVKFCEDVEAPKGLYYYGKLWIRGNIVGRFVNHTVDFNMERTRKTTYIQTDKYLYQPGQKVKMRILTVDSVNLTVSNEFYPEVFVRTPSRVRIAQWNNVDNSGGLVHLELTLADEPEQGRYRIVLKRADNSTSSTYFKVEEYVLPRFEIIMKPPKNVLAIDDSFIMEVCARYTYGQPVQGNLTLEISNNNYRACRVVRNFTTEINGCDRIQVDSASIRMIDCQVHSVRMRALVTEGGTGVTLEEMAYVSIYRRAVEFEELYKDNYQKPGLPYTIKVKAKRPDSTPASGVPVEICSGETCYNTTTPNDGVIIVTVGAHEAKRVIMKALNTRAAMDESSYYTSIEKYYSPSHSSLLIHAPEDTLKCAEGSQGLEYVLPVFFVSDQPTASITVQVISKHNIQYWKTEQYDLLDGDLPISQDQMSEPLSNAPQGTRRGVVNIPIVLPNAASPSARILVWMVRHDGEVVSDTREVEVEKCLPNEAELAWSKNEGGPGEEVQVLITSSPNSLCSLGVVDKSTQLLDTRSKSLTLENLFSPLMHFKVNRWSSPQINDYEYCKNQLGVDEDDYGRYYTNYVDALKMFSDAGVFVLSDLKVETRPCEKRERHGYYSPHRAYNKVSGMDANRVQLESVSYSDSSSLGPMPAPPMEQDTVRTHFPETWLWDLHVLPRSGVYSSSVNLPDTITEWIGQTVCVHPEKGLGLSQQTNITTFTPFFLDLTLPPSMKRGEVLGVQVSVFNYLEHPLPVVIKMHTSNEYEILSDPSSQKPLGELRACVSKKSKVVLEVKIKPTIIGEVNITVTASVDNSQKSGCGVSGRKILRRDTLVKPLTVKAEGFQREKTWSKYICARELQEGNDSLERWEVAAPGAIVEGSDRGWVTVVGNLLTLTLNNLGHLIRMPYGCGEQNMINFAPNIFILDYLTVTRQSNHEAVAKLKRHMTTGYQRQLLYLRDDGSYSAFGSADPSGSTWLTAFVVKSFAKAQPYILIDEENLEKSRKWLYETRDESGCSLNFGQVFSKALKGHSGESSMTLTAFVIVSLLEADGPMQGPPIPPLHEAIQCLLSHTTPAHDVYPLALKAYALALAGAQEAKQTLEVLMSQAVVTRNSIHWDLPMNMRSKSLAVETAAYALLAMLTLDSTQYNQQARKVVKWITGERNGRGGFYSTQDTVVALQALAMYESFQYQGEVNLVATVKGTGVDHSFAVDEDNKLVTQRASLKTLPTTLTLTMIGQGCAVFQSVLRYNVHDPEPSDTFSLTVGARTAPDKTCITKRINFCVSYLLSDNKSNMGVVEVDVVSGYIPMKEDLKRAIKDNDGIIKRYEVDGSKVSFFVEEFTKGEDVCVRFRVTRIVEVENAKPGSITVYDYYQPEFSISKIYILPPNDECVYAW